ncbi:hypothetical protein LTR62_001544 [Meristemomyces frigidus]|uniref:Uncharacterized protein n=1 Tax=Meristemomyces frigidus TaxID=1508187 RepID=A0AAN7YQL5_9PEZI|nr:hypothetical protein LTR62_001544 [Meristemomyces frigidus]
MASIDPEFPCSLLIHIPFPTHRLAKVALGSLSADEELSLLVKRSFSLIAVAHQGSTIDRGSLAVTGANDNVKATTDSVRDLKTSPAPQPSHNVGTHDDLTTDKELATVLRVDYKATTNRMLRVAVNGFFESLGVVIQVMEELDVDVLHEKGLEDLEGVQGVEQGMTGTTVTGA